jgi:hypothetical protein
VGLIPQRQGSLVTPTAKSLAIWVFRLPRLVVSLSLFLSAAFSGRLALALVTLPALLSLVLVALRPAWVALAV